MYWPGIEVMTIHFLCIIGPFSTVNISSDRFPCLRAWPQRTRRWVHPKESWKLQRFVMGIQNKHLIFFAHCILPTVIDILELSFLMFFYIVKNVSFTRCQPRGGYFRIPFDLFSWNGGVGNNCKMHVRSCRRWFPTDKRSPVAVKV